MPVLDATAITVSMLRGDFETAGSVMFLLGIGEILDEWTHKKSVADLAGRCRSTWTRSGWKPTDGSVALSLSARCAPATDHRPHGRDDPA